MKNIAFIIALSLLHAVNAAAVANAPEQQRIDGDSLIRAVHFLGGSARILTTISDFGTVETLENFNSRIEENRSKLLERSAALPEAMQLRIDDFFKGIVRRVLVDYEKLMQTVVAVRQILNPLLVGEVHMCFPEPISTSCVVAGKEQAACDAVKELLNLCGEYKNKKALLVGLRKVDDNQLIMFVSGVKQLVKNDQVYVANPVLQALYMAYADSRADQSQIYALEAQAAPHLLDDNERPTYVNFYDVLTYPGKEQYYPDERKREEVLDTAAIIRLLSEKQSNLTPAQKANIQSLADQLECSKRKIEEQKRLIASEQECRNQLLNEEKAASTTMYASFAPEVERIKAALAEAAAVRVQAINALLTSENNELWEGIERTLDNIQSCIKNTTKTPAGWKSDELIMDYGSEINSSITRAMRTNTEQVLNNQLTILGVTGWDMREQKNFQDIANTLFQWFQTQDLGFSPADKQIAQTVLNAMAITAPADIANNTHLQFLAAIYKLYRLSAFYQQWPNINERENFLAQLKTTIHQAFEQVLAHKGYPLRCATGARGRAFVLNVSIISCMRSQNQ